MKTTAIDRKFLVYQSSSPGLIFLRATRRVWSLGAHAGVSWEWLLMAPFVS